jgi:radical SAM superfamily enzyme YgiQ (UPF0313 family)
MRVLLVSTYELGHQPLHVTGPAADLQAAGHDVRILDVSVDPWDDTLVDWAEAVAFSVPMHTAMRMALAGVDRVRARRPALPVALYGLYAAVGGGPVDSVCDRDRIADPSAHGVRRIAGEYTDALVAWVGETAPDTATTLHLGRKPVNRLPARDLAPGLDRYARLSVGGEERVVGYVEASRGCAHRCRHCPVPVIYDGRTRIVDVDAVVADVAQQVAAGARHITFGDPDFFNGVHHGMRVVDAVHAGFPNLTFDATIKVEHILKHPDVWPAMAAAGCLFVVSAFESVDDATLERLDKGHTTAEMAAAVELLRRSNIEIRPSWLPFTPWTTPGSVADLVDFVVAHDLVANVDPVQYSIRLLLPDGSLLLDHPDMRPHLGAYDAEHLSWTWTAADPSADRLQAQIAILVEEAAAADESPDTTFLRIQHAVAEAAGRPRLDALPPGLTPSVERPRLTEPWFCCSEPTALQVQAATQ